MAELTAWYAEEEGKLIILREVHLKLPRLRQGLIAIDSPDHPGKFQLPTALGRKLEPAETTLSSSIGLCEGKRTKRCRDRRKWHSSANVGQVWSAGIRPLLWFTTAYQKEEGSQHSYL